jgi:hypothetical protein
MESGGGGNVAVGIIGGGIPADGGTVTVAEASDEVSGSAAT